MGPPTDREVSFITTVGSLGRWRSEMKRRLIDIEEAAHYLGLKKSTLYSWAWSLWSFWYYRETENEMSQIGKSSTSPTGSSLVLC